MRAAGRRAAFWQGVLRCGTPSGEHSAFSTSVRSALESELQNKVNELRNALLDDNMNMLNRVIGTLRSQLTPPVCKVPGTVMISTVDASQGWTIDGPPQPAMVYTINGWQCVCELGGGAPTAAGPSRGEECAARSLLTKDAVETRRDDV